MRRRRLSTDSGHRLDHPQLRQAAGIDTGPLRPLPGRRHEDGQSGADAFARFFLLQQVEHITAVQPGNSPGRPSFHLAIFTELLASLAHNGDFKDTTDIEKYAVKLLLCYVDVGLPDLLNELVNKLLTVPPAVQVIVSSFKIMRRANLTHQATDGGPGKAQLIGVLPAFVKERISFLASLLEKYPNAPTKSFRDASPQERQHPEMKLRYDLSSALMYLLCLLDKADSGLKDHREGLSILQPVLSKMNDARMIQFVLDSWWIQMKTIEPKRLLSEICQRVVLPDRIEPAVFIDFLRVFSDQGEASEGLLKSLVDALLGKSAPPVDSAVFKEILSGDGWEHKNADDASTLLIRGVTSKVMAAWMAVLVEKDDVTEAKQCIETAIRLKHRFFKPDFDPVILLPFIARMSTDNLLDLLICLKIQITYHLRPLLEDSSQYASLGRNLISEFLGREDAKESMKNWHDSKEKVLGCLVWLGDSSCMESFIRVLSATRDGQRQVVRLASSILYHRKFYCSSLSAIHPTGSKVLGILLDHCIEGLGRIWKQTGAVVPGYPAVENFLRSSNQSMVLNGFDNRIEEARQFSEELQRSYRVKVQVRESDDNTVWVEISKVLDEAWLAECSKDWFHCEGRHRELDNLMNLRKMLPIWEATASAGTERPADQNGPSE